MASVFRRQMVNTSALWGMPHKKALFAAHNERGPRAFSRCRRHRPPAAAICPLAGASRFVGGKWRTMLARIARQITAHGGIGGRAP